MNVSPLHIPTILPLHFLLKVQQPTCAHCNLLSLFFCALDGHNCFGGFDLPHVPLTARPLAASAKICSTFNFAATSASSASSLLFLDALIPPFLNDLSSRLSASLRLDGGTGGAWAKPSTAVFLRSFGYSYLVGYSCCRRVVGALPFVRSRREEPLDLLLEPSLNDLLLLLVVGELAEVEEVVGGSMKK